MCKYCFISFFCNRELNSGDNQLLLRKMRPYEQRFDCKLFFQYTETFACEVSIWLSDKSSNQMAKSSLIVEWSMVRYKRARKTKSQQIITENYQSF